MAEADGVARERRAFEPERAFAPAADDFCADDFFTRELGILCEQGNFERARVLLAKRAVEHPDAADLFYDAIRVERSAAPGGAAFQAWVTRGLTKGAQIAPRLRALVPEEALRAYLVREAVGWTLLERQKDTAAARELLRLRLQHELDADPNAALTCVEEPAMIRCARTDPELMRIAVGVLAGALWRAPERALALAKQLGVELGAKVALGADAGSAREAHALLEQASCLHGAWAAVMQREPCPALDRFVRIGRLVATERARALLADLAAELQVRPREYLRCAQAITEAPHGLATVLIAALRSAAHELQPRPDPPAAKAAEPEAALGERLQRCARTVAEDPLQRIWLAALVASASAFGLAWLWTPTIALLYAPVVLLLWPLRRSVDATIYRRSLRAGLLATIVAEGCSAAQLAQRLEASSSRPLRRFAARTGDDAALALIGEIAQLGRTPHANA